MANGQQPEEGTICHHTLATTKIIVDGFPPILCQTISKATYKRLNSVIHFCSFTGTWDDKLHGSASVPRRRVARSASPGTVLREVLRKDPQNGFLKKLRGQNTRSKRATPSRVLLVSCRHSSVIQA